MRWQRSSQLRFACSRSRKDLPQALDIQAFTLKVLLPDTSASERKVYETGCTSPSL